MSQANWIDDLQISCLFCGHALISTRNRTDLLHCPNKKAQPIHPESQEIWVWVEQQAINYRVDGIQLSYNMQDAHRAKEVTFFATSPTLSDGFEKAIVLAENLDIDFSEIKTLEDFRAHLKLLKAYG